MRATALAPLGLDIAGPDPRWIWRSKARTATSNASQHISDADPETALGQITDGDGNLDTRHGIYRDGA